MTPRTVQINGSYFEKQPGKARSYVNVTTGERISRRQLDKLRAERNQIPKRSEVINEKVRRGVKQSKADAEAVKARLGERVTIRQAQADPQLRADRKTLRKIGEIPAKQRSATQNEALRDALERMGRRIGIPASVPVGSTNKYLVRKFRRRQRDAAKRATGHRNRG